MRFNFVPLDQRIPEDPKLMQRFLEDTIRQLNQQLLLLNQVIRGNLSFGNGEVDNLAGRWHSYTTSGAEDTITHNLGVVPVGVLVLVPPAYGFITKGSTAWTSTNLYLMCGEASQSVTVFILPPTNTES